MTSPEPECTCVEPEKNGVDFRDAARKVGPNRPVRLPGRRSAIRPVPDIILGQENYRSFLGVYDLVRAPFRRRYGGAARRWRTAQSAQ
jgi:hypothetical protein